MSRLTRISFLLTFFFALDKGLAILRQVIIARQFGFSAELDAFNVANNLPDLLFALISGGAMGMAFIPALSETLSKQGKKAAWDLFSRIANLAFLVTGLLAIIIAILADPLVKWEIGIAPGFTLVQQNLVINLMRLNLIATLIFSISGLVMGGLQANQHFLLPAAAPLLYNIGQIVGALILSPEKGYQIGGITLPAFGLGSYGLVCGVIIGAFLHLGIQIPALIKYQFRWTPAIGLRDTAVKNVLRLLGPRLLTMLFIQLIFIVRDNLASRLGEGSVSALTYGWMIQQVPETLLGTAIATALLPTLAEMSARKEIQQFHQTIERAVRVLFAICVPMSVILAAGLYPLLSIFRLNVSGTDLLLRVSQGFLVGLLGHSLMEIAARSFYAQKDALTPLKTGALNFVVYIILTVSLSRFLGPAGISLGDSLAFTGQAILLFWLLYRRSGIKISLGTIPLRGLVAAGISGCIVVLIMQIPASGWVGIFLAITGITAGLLITVPFIRNELRLLLHLGD